MGLWGMVSSALRDVKRGLVGWGDLALPVRLLGVRLGPVSSIDIADFILLLVKHVHQRAGTAGASRVMYWVGEAAWAPGL